MPREGISRIPSEKILRYEEILEVVRAGAALGIRKIRITGGEPLVRKDITRFLSSLQSVEGIVDVCLTTNGVLLKGMARSLKQAGLDRVTVSLDSLRPERYQEITGCDALAEVMQGIEQALSVGLWPLKINVVAIRGLNEDEIADFARMSVTFPIEVRFIERMPIGKREETRGCGLWDREGLTGDEILERIEEAMGPLEQASAVVPLPGPARLYRAPGSAGRIGLITPMTHPFCNTCTRLRLTPDGKLRSCLLRSDEIDVLGPLRSEGGRQKLTEILERAFQAKLKGMGEVPGSGGGNGRWMVQIGG